MGIQINADDKRAMSIMFPDVNSFQRVVVALEAAFPNAEVVKFPDELQQEPDQLVECFIKPKSME